MKTSCFAIGVLSCLITLLTAPFAMAQPGSFDLGFNVGSGANTEVYSTICQSDGKVIVAGSFNVFNGVSVNRIVRLNEDGSLDNTFLTAVGVNNFVYATAIQPDGKIIIGGDFTSFNGITKNYVARLNSDGSLDNSFNINSGANDRVNNITIQPDGKIIIGGYFTAYNGVSRNYIARLNVDGTLDNSFDPGTGANNWVYCTSLQPDGKILLGGDFTGYNLTESYRIVRLNSDGTVDQSFNTGLGANNGIRSIYIQSDGRILAGGNFTSFNGMAANYIQRINADGTVDNTFNTGTGANNGIYSMLALADGKVIAVGAFTTFNGTARSRVVRLQSNGALDAAFNPGTGADYWVISASLQPDGKLILGGAFNAYNGNTSNGVCRIENSCVASAGVDLQTACNQFTWIDGITYTSSNTTATYTLAGGAANGCDSLVTLNLTILNAASGVDTQTACGEFTWIDGNTYTADNNTATYTLAGAAANGCDSLIALNLTILNAASGVDVHSACSEFTWIDGNTYTADNNTATYTIVGGAANGCDSLVTLNLTIYSVSDIGTSLSANSTITANNPNASYQWLNCNDNYALIAGANSQTFIPVENGSYAVQLIENGCADTSACVVVSSLALYEKSMDYLFSIYPNPTQGDLSVLSNKQFHNASITVRNTLGQEVAQHRFSGTTQTSLHLNGPAGVYFIEILDEGKRMVFNVIKE
jgi:uncharacterized delta-60 repeat protein